MSGPQDVPELLGRRTSVSVEKSAALSPTQPPFGKDLDLPLLAAHFLRQHAGRYRKPMLRFDEGALQAILSHRWPGNVRELEHAVERSVLMAAGDTVRAADLGLQPSGDGRARLDEMSLEDVERALIQKALSRHSGNVTLAAKDLGLSRSGLYRRLKRHQL